MEARCDVVVVGAGLLGLAAARALARRGREVTVLEQAEIGHEGCGSKGSCRIFRLGYGDAWWVGLAMRARGPWADLEDECGRRLLQPTPHLTFGPELEVVRQAMDSAGAPHELLPAAEAAARFPAVSIGGPALLEPGSCVISADAALRALAAAVPDIRGGTAVTGIEDDGRRVTVHTASGPVTARAAVVCAGPWTSGLLAAAGSVTALSRMNASRIQLLGSRRRPSPERGPRYGVLFRGVRMNDLPLARRGAYARSLASLAAIAIRADATTHAPVAEKLVARRDRRVEALRRRDR